MKSCSETPRGFQEEEEPCTSYSQRGEGMKHEGHLESEILSEYLVEYKAKSRAFKETLALTQFIQLEEETLQLWDDERKYISIFHF